MAPSQFQGGSIGLDFADNRIASIGFQSPQTLLDKDVVFLALSRVPWGYLPPPDWDFQEFRGVRRISDDDSFRLPRDLSRRREELTQLTTLGKTIVIFIEPPVERAVYTGQDKFSGTGQNRQRTRIVDVIDIADLLLPFEYQTRAGASDKLEPGDTAPIASFWDMVGHRLEAEAVLVKPLDEPFAFIRGTKSCVASVTRIGNGLVLFLPAAINGDYVEDLPAEAEDPEDVAFVDAVFELITQLRKEVGDYDLPEWADRFRLPGEADAIEEIRKAEDRAGKALQTATRRREQLVKLQQRKLLITGTGAAFERAAESALEALGFEVLQGRPGRTDRILKLNDVTAVMEAKGKKKSASEADAAQLEKWVSDYSIENEGSQAKGVLIVNAWRDEELDKRRTEAFPDQMVRQYCEPRGHCLLTGTQLLGAWLEVERKPSSRERIAKDILKCVGRFPRFSDSTAIFEDIAGGEKDARAKADTKKMT